MRFRTRQAVLGLLGIVAVLFMLCWNAPRVWTRWVGTKGEPPPSSVFGPSVPSDAGDVHQLEEQARAVAEAVLPAVVAVRSPVARPKLPGLYDNYGSGVIVTEDGLVLSQWHVSHERWIDDTRTLAGEKTPTYLAGEKTSVMLHDGRECSAVLLGADRDNDVSLLRLVEPGPYPFVPLSPDGEVQLGDWVLKVGHPIGYRRERSAPVRLGRVVNRIDEIFSTDCPTTGGDSGGPFFSVNGQLIGIARGFSSLSFFAVRTDDPLVALRVEAVMTATAARPIHDVFERMLAGEIFQSEVGHFEHRLPYADQLRAKDWTQGRATLAKFRSFVAPARSSTVVVLNHGVAVGLGTVVAPDAVITKASELPSAPTCRLADGRTVAARVVGVEPAFDLALLKVQATGLKPIEWSEDLEPPGGTMLAAAGPQELPLAVGVLSVARYELENPRTQTNSLPLRLTAYRPAVFGTSQENGAYAVWRACGLAWSAGIRPGDVLLKLAGHRIRADDDLTVAVDGHWSGEVVSVVIERNKETLRLPLPLAPKPSPPIPSINYRRDDFPVLLECGVPFLSFECGGPIVDRSGRSIGISIAHVAPHGGMVIPADCVQRVLPALQAGKLATHWTPATLPN